MDFMIDSTTNKLKLLFLLDKMYLKYKYNALITKIIPNVNENSILATKNNSTPAISAVKEEVSDNFKHSLNLNPFFLLNKVGNLNIRLTVKTRITKDNRELDKFTINLVSNVDL